MKTNRFLFLFLFVVFSLVFSLVSLSHRVPGTEALRPKPQLRGLCAEALQMTKF